MKIRHSEKRLYELKSNDHVELAYLKLGVTGLMLEVEFPSDWHDERRGWFRLGLGLLKFCFSFPWKWVVDDHYQCSGPTYGFQFYEDLLWIRWGKAKGTRDDPSKTVRMPWAWKHKEHKVLTMPETHAYRYIMNSGTIQKREATIQKESRTWTRWWIPYKRVDVCIDVRFNDEVGERSGTWKGGTIGCSYAMLPTESPAEALRRMEKERRF
jgi:hypothetical protein